MSTSNQPTIAARMDETEYFGKSPALLPGASGIESLGPALMLTMALLLKLVWRRPAPLPASMAATFTSQALLAGETFGASCWIGNDRQPTRLGSTEPFGLPDFNAVPCDTPHLALMILAIDGLKQINTAHGRHSGNALLDEATTRIHSILSPQDTVARLGNGHFAILSPGRNSAQAALLAGTLLREMRRVFQIAGQPITVTASIGIACTLNDTTPARKLMEHASTAMRQAKSHGRNRYCFFEPAMLTASPALGQIARDLPQALRDNELTLHYQPRFDIASGCMLGAEALLRWQHPSRGAIPPSQFIRVAEETGMICHLGNWALDQACRQMRRWRDSGVQHPRLSVNVSALQLNSPSFADDIAAKLAQYGLEPCSLTVEITESAAMQDIDASLLTLHRLAGIGVRISLDDFGVGHSSLLHLKRFPIHELKIDRGFIHDIENSLNDRAIVSAIIQLARTLKLCVVAEGVETEGQRHVLARLGCDSLQGYLLGEPVPADQLLDSNRAFPARAARDAYPNHDDIQP